ncbi:SusD/RagB family nutrient-binding outer membrane lipoprotein [Mucilaginibacter conchicola]|uniref:SusD/RagB family nutrient-binding outer membrane lipoprotein n=2 Tax=Mucilaginibacter conchicola TaxID=2303333 RepID=A0A372NX92_9SPHI|nr:SusD/RagB family nutrient-binding outer membrane lipoprotein [Mucilaginibacter conchicola]
MKLIMKKQTTTLYIVCSTLFLSLFTGCSKDFEQINTDPTQLSQGTFKYEYLFTTAQLYANGNPDGYANGMFQSSMSYASTMMQHLSATNPVWYGDKYIYNANYNGSYWTMFYGSGIKAVVDVVENSKDKPEKNNLYNTARILRAWYFQQMTDIYGDVPYSEAGLGFTQGKTNPKYDDQQSIYNGLLAELEDAASKLNADPAANTLKSADLFYQGDVAKWKKFAYSEMLRLALRLSKVDAPTGSNWAKKAVAGGLMQSNDDNALVPHEDQNTRPPSNPVGLILHSREPNSYRLSKTFVDFLKANNDPRLGYFGAVITDPTNTADFGNENPAVQMGQPNGYDKTGGPKDISTAPGYPGDQNKYSVVNRHTFARENAPSFILTYAETQLLLAEAAQRGWVTGTASTFYNQGVMAAILQLNQTGANISDGTASAYATAHPLVANTALQQINEQYWVATFSDWLETWSNWRRSGFPVLTPVNYQGNSTNGTIPRRFVYPLDEASVNPANYSAAAGKIAGGDKLTSRVWWDKQ